MLKDMIGVILLNLGGPDSPEAVKPFLLNLFSDREIIKLGPKPLQKYIAALIVRRRAPKTISAYAKIGGASPILPISRAQAKALEEQLNSGKRAPHFLVGVGMRYWHPYIQDTMADLYEQGARRFIALSLYPQYSVATSGSSLRIFLGALERYPECSSITVGSWHRHPLYIDAMAARIREALEQFAAQPTVLFSAHSLPQSFIKRGDPYLKQTQETIAAILNKVPVSWHLSFQSRSGPVKWLEPSTESMLKQLARNGVRDILIVPISFVSDHIETLFEIDIEYQELAHSLGITMKRMPSLNTAPAFIAALADIVQGAAKERQWL